MFEFKMQFLLLIVHIFCRVLRAYDFRLKKEYLAILLSKLELVFTMNLFDLVLLINPHLLLLFLTLITLLEFKIHKLT